MTHFLLFDLIGVLVEAKTVRQQYRANLAQIMSARYGNTPDFWRKIDQQIVEDWASFHADLNFSGDDGIADMHEALFRVTRALFTMAHISEPPKPEITTLANDLISTPHGVLLPDVLPMLEKCQKQGCQIGGMSYFLDAQTTAILHSTALEKYIKITVSPDTLNHYDHDARFFEKVRHHLQVQSEQITVISHSVLTHTAAIQSGINAVLVRQSAASLDIDLTEILEHNLWK